MQSLKHNRRGFTVLEFLIVIAIMAILISLILVGLTAARRNARDQAKISNVHTIVVGLTQFKDICRVYPATLEGTETCSELGTSKLSDLIVEIDSYFTNPDYKYTGLALDPNDPTSCTGFHIGVQLENDSNAAASKSGFSGGTSCAGIGNEFDGTQAGIFDIKKPFDTKQ